MSPAPVIIAIDGRSGAGKTTLAIELAARLREHHKVSLFHLEDIYPGWNGLAAGIERYASTVLAPLHRGEPAEWVSWDWNAHYDGDTRTTLPAEIVLVEGVGAAAEAARPYLAAVIWADSPELDRRSRALARDGESYEPYWDEWAAQEQEWLAEDDVPAHADVLVHNLADGAAPAEVLQALQYLPALSPALVPELAARRGLELRAERIDAAPDAARLFESLFGRSANAAWLDSSLAPEGQRRGTEPLQHPGGRRRPLRPVGPAQFGQHPGEHRQRQRPDRGALLPLARRGLGPPCPPRPRGLPLRVHPGLARLPRLRTQTRDRRQ